MYIYICRSTIYIIGLSFYARAIACRSIDAHYFVARDEIRESIFDPAPFRVSRAKRCIANIFANSYNFLNAK